MLEQLRFVRIPVQSVCEAKKHAVDIVGLQHSEHLPEAERFRADARSYCVELDGTKSTSRPVIGLSLRTVEQLDAVFVKLKDRNWDVEAIPKDLCLSRRYYAGLACRDLSGNHIELVVRAENHGERYFPSRDAGIVGLSHVILGSRDPASDAAVWVDILGARITDRVGESIYLGWDDQHHRIMLVPSKRDNFIVVAFEVESIDAVMQSQYFLLQRQVRIVRGPGKEPASGEVFLTFSGPTLDSYFTYSARSEPCPVGRPPRQFANDPTSLCSWGSVCELEELGGTLL